MSDMPPPPPPPSATPSATAATSTTKNPAGIGKALWISLLVYACAHGINMIAYSHRTTILQQVSTGSLSPYSSDITSADDFVTGTRGLVLLASLTTFVLLIIWLYRITKHSRALGANFPRSNGWAIGGFFVPLMNFFVPYGFARDNFDFYLSRGLIQKKEKAFVTVWWMTFTLCSLYSQSISLPSDPTLDNLKSYDISRAGASFLLSASAVVEVLAIRAISRASSKIE